jgi:hypothetical protein
MIATYAVTADLSLNALAQTKVLSPKPTKCADTAKWVGTQSLQSCRLWENLTYLNRSRQAVRGSPQAQHSQLPADRHCKLDYASE